MTALGQSGTRNTDAGGVGSFTVEATAPDTRARAATLVTEHGVIPTPIFMPVGTRGAVRTQTLAQINELAPPILLANTYHLMVRPGRELFERVGGLHAWMKWRGAVLTDSGGFQIFSLAGREMTEEGARFRDRASPGPFLLTPESSIGMQRAIGSDIMMVLDQCIDSTSSIDHARAAMELTHRWAKRSLDAHRTLPPGPTKEQLLFAIVQGACYPDLRRESARALTDLGGFDGYAIGGLAVGESKAQREDTTALVTDLLPKERPRYLMGVGTPLDLLEAVHRGVDMFDCILPTAWAQHGKAFTSHGRIDMRRGVHKSSDAPLDTTCPCVACTTYERSFLHHLVKAQEPLGWQLLANHNLRFYLSLMKEIRGHIVAGTFATYYADKRVRLAIDDEDNPPGPKPKSKPVKPNTRGAFTVATHSDGFASIQHVASGEIMHSVNRPDDEAERVYVKQSALIAENVKGTRPLVVWDVGLGAAHNAMALIRALESANHAPVELISFENDTDAFQLALAHQKEFLHLRHAAAHVLAKFGSYTRGALMWRLVTGDFRATFAAEKTPDVIFYDPFSAKVDAPLWTLAAFRALRAKLDGPTELFTYTASTAIRSALLGAGFWVARGVPSGPKEETTIALVPSDPLFSRHALLDAAWLARRGRSTAKLPSDVPTELAAELENAIANHPQFAADLAIASEVLDGRACVS